jgi:hypothetical protein
MAFSIVILMITVLWTVTADDVTIINSYDGSISTLKLRQTFAPFKDLNGGSDIAFQIF